MTKGSKPATAQTKAANAAVLDRLAFDDERDFADMKRGFIAVLPDGGVIRNDHGDVVFDGSAFDYIDGPAPDSVNSSLWRQSEIFKRAGFFQVTDPIYQIRNHELANVTIVEGQDGLIVIDVGSTTETS